MSQSKDNQESQENQAKKRNSRWTVYDSWDRLSLLEAPGCYALYIDDSLVYIGQAVNAKRRINQYRMREGYGGGVFHSIAGEESFARKVTIKVKYSRRLGDWAMVEIRLIKRLQPKFNAIHGGQKQRANPQKGRPSKVVYLTEPSEDDLLAEIVHEDNLEDDRETERQRKFFMRGGKARVGHGG